MINLLKMYKQAHPIYSSYVNIIINQNKHGYLVLMQHKYAFSTQLHCVSFFYASKLAYVLVFCNFEQFLGN